jgi:uncharacterized protein YbjT (DUF2867 family)
MVVRAAARRREVLQARAWRDVDIVAADALDPDSLDRALQGIEIAYYLVHSMAAGAHFPQIDREAAAHFRDAAARAGVRRIVYLGGLQPHGGASAHLASRGETGDILRSGPVPVTELRAGVIIGPGSAAFEIIRDLVFHLPAMVTPRWVSSRSQPIALADILEYLLQLSQLEVAEGATYDCGGPEVLTYRDLMRQFGDLVGRRPLIVPLPVLTPRLSSYWLDLVTAVPSNVARALIDGLEHDVLADDAALRALIPRRLIPYREAAQAAFKAERDHWSVAEGLAPTDLPEPGAQSEAATGAPWTEGSMLYRRNRPDFAFYAKHMSGEAVANAPASALWDVVRSIGGDNGYYFLDTLWALRARLDELAGGSGMRRGRRDPKDLVIGDTVDFWRVAALEPGRRLTLLAEMKMPGSASLAFEVHAMGEQRSRVVATASFHPAGVKGLLYWHALAPAHVVIFPGLARAIARRAEAGARAAGAAPAPP